MVMIFIETPLHIAAIEGKENAVETLLHCGANSNEKDVRK